MAIDRKNGEIAKPVWTDDLVAEAQIAAGVKVLGGETKALKAALLEKGLRPGQVHKFMQSAEGVSPDTARASIAFNVELVSNAGLVNVGIPSLEAGYRAIGSERPSTMAFVAHARAMDRRYYPNR